MLTYSLIEEEAPVGYEKSNDVYTVQIRRGQARVMTFLGGTSKTVFPLEVSVFKSGINIGTNNITVVNDLASNIMLNVFNVPNTSLQAENNSSGSPHTGDNIMTNIIILSLSLGGMFGGITCFIWRRRKLN